MVPGLGLMMLLVFALAKLWLSNRHYLRIAQAEPLEDGEFLASCIQVTGQIPTHALAFDIRNTIEEYLSLPRGTLRGDTDLSRFGLVAYFLYAPAIMKIFQVSVESISHSGLNVKLLGNLIAAIDKVLQERGDTYESTVQSPAQDSEPGNSRSEACP